MSLPQFTAAASLYRSSNDYAGISVRASSPDTLSVTPQRYWVVYCEEPCTVLPRLVPKMSA